MKPFARMTMLAAVALAAGCATVPADDGLPKVRYAQALSRGGVAAVLTPRPTEADVREAEALWRRGLSDALACGEPRLEVVRIGLAGAAELASMSAAARDGDGRVDEALLRRYAMDLAGKLISRGPRPPAPRCRAVAAWSDRVRADGQEAIGRAISKGLLPLL